MIGYRALLSTCAATAAESICRGSGENHNCLLVENSNLPVLGRALEQAITRLANDPSAYTTEIANGVATACHYQDPEAEAKSLAAVFDPILSKSE